MDADDADAVLVLADDAASRRWSPSMRTLFDRADAVGWIERRLARRTDWAVVDAATGVLAGRVGLHHHDADDRSCEIGYGVCPAFRRRGVAGRAVEAALAYAFAPAPDGLGRNRVTLQHAVGNVASCRAAWSHGFVFEGPPAGPGPRRRRLRRRPPARRLASDPAGPLPRVVPAEPVEIAAGPYQLCVPDPALDAAEVAAAHADPLTALWNPGPPDLDGARAWCARRADWSSGEHASWLVKAAAGGGCSARCPCTTPTARTAARGSATGWRPAARGRGVGTAALSAAARFAFGGVGAAPGRAVPRASRTTRRAGWPSGPASGSRACTATPSGTATGSCGPSTRMPGWRPTERVALADGGRQTQRQVAAAGGHHRLQPQPDRHRPQLGRELLAGVRRRVRLGVRGLHEQPPGPRGRP